MEVVPNTVLHTFEGGFTQVETDKLFAGKRIVLFALIGAFTPTCTETHLPRYEELYRAFVRAGIDEIYCVTVNDAFVVNAFVEVMRIKHVKMLPDGNGTLCKNLGMLMDRSDVGLGPRAKRFSLIINDLKIEKAFVEEEDFGFAKTDADSVLTYLAPNACRPPQIAIITRANCAFCSKAKEALTKARYTFVELPIPDHARPIALRAVTGQKSVPQVFVNGQLIGGSKELTEWLEQNPVNYEHTDSTHAVSRPDQ